MKYHMVVHLHTIGNTGTQVIIMARKKADHSSRREAPIQFRLGAELGHLVNTFASRHGLQVGEACRVLIALAATEMDSRYYELIRQVAEAMGGDSAFFRACLHVHTALDGARRATNTAMQLDPERSLFIERTAQDFLAGRGLQAGRLAFLPRREQDQPEEPSGPASSPRTQIDPTVRKKRTIRHTSEDEEDAGR